MPTIDRLPTTTTTTEPVALELLRQWVRVDGTAEDAVLEMLLKAAREKAENYTGRYFVGGQRLAYTFDLSEAYAVPEGATVESVSGFFTSLEELENWSLEEYRKGIHINRERYWGEAISHTYTVKLQMPATVDVPQVVVAAILELAAEWYKNRESSVNGTISVQTQVNWQSKLAQLVVNPLG